MIRQLASVSLLAAVLPSLAGAQSPGKCGSALSWKSLQDRVDILHNLNTTKEVAQPAFLQYTWPDSGTATGAVSAAAKLALCNSDLLGVGPFVEYIWNNLTDKRQNTLRVGLDADWQLAALSRAGASQSPLVLAQINYKSDREKHTEGAQLVAQLTWVSTNRAWPAPNSTWRLGQSADFIWSPHAGVIVDRVLRAKDTGAEGTVIRGLIRIDASLFPAAVQLEKRIEAFVSYTVQSDLKDGTSETDDRHPFSRVGANVFLYRDDQKAAGITLVRVSGEDPTLGFLRQRYWQLGFTLRVN